MYIFAFPPLVPVDAVCENLIPFHTIPLLHARWPMQQNDWDCRMCIGTVGVNLLWNNAHSATQEAEMWGTLLHWKTPLWPARRIRPSCERTLSVIFFSKQLNCIQFSAIKSLPKEANVHFYITLWSKLTEMSLTQIRIEISAVEAFQC